MRRAFTLLELLAVITIILVLASMMVLLWPKPQPETDTTTRLQGWLVEARMYALRDQRPYGVQVLNGIPMIVEQPDDIVGAPVSFTSDGTTITGTDTFPETIQPGDWLEKGTGNVSDIVLITSASVTTITAKPQVDSTIYFWTGANVVDWRVVPQPHMLLGSTPLPVTSTITPDQTVLFGPAGNLVGASSPVRWIVGSRFVVQVQPGTGAIQVAPVAPGADPFAFCRDGKGSGF